jgi:hypothetical protein
MVMSRGIRNGGLCIQTRMIYQCVHTKVLHSCTQTRILSGYIHKRRLCCCECYTATSTHICFTTAPTPGLCTMAFTRIREYCLHTMMFDFAFTSDFFTLALTRSPFYCMNPRMHHLLIQTRLLCHCHCFTEDSICTTGFAQRIFIISQGATTIDSTRSS